MTVTAAQSANRVAVDATTRESHADEWAAWDEAVARRIPIVRGEPGNCGGCGRFRSKSVRIIDGYPPTIFHFANQSTIMSDPGWIEITYRCNNPDEDFE